MAEVVFIQPGIPGERSKAPSLGSTENLGLGYLAAITLRAGHAAHIVDADGEGLSPEVATARAIDVRADIVCIAPVAESMGAALEIAKRIKGSAKRPFVAFGGHHASNCYRDILENDPQVDAVALGDAERTFEDLLAGWPRVKPSSSFITRENLGDSGHRRHQEMDLDSVPWPHRPGLGTPAYGDEARMITSRGCPYRCAFCTTPTMYDTLARRSIGDVIEEMRHLRRHGVKHIWLNDDLFVVGSNQGVARVHEFCAALRKADIGVSFRPMARVDSFRKDPGLVDELIAAGMSHIFLGIESGSDADLLRLQKDADAADNLRTLEFLYEKDVFVQIGFIMFNPWSGFRDLRDNVAFLAETGEGYRPFPYFRSLSVFPGTAVWSQLAKDGLQGSATYKSGSSLDYAFADPRVEVLSRLQHRAYDQIAVLDSGIYRTASRLRRSGDISGWRAHRTAGVEMNTRFFEHILTLAENGTLSQGTHSRVLAEYRDQLQNLVGVQEGVGGTRVRAARPLGIQIGSQHAQRTAHHRRRSRADIPPARRGRGDRAHVDVQLSLCGVQPQAR